MSRQTRDNNGLHTEPRVARVSMFSEFAAARLTRALSRRTPAGAICVLDIRRIEQLRSGDWALEIAAILDGLQVILEWNGEADATRPDFRWITLSFGHPASWAIIDYSQMWQHAPGDSDCVPLLVSNMHPDNATHLSGVTLNLESRPEWMSFRVTAQSNAIQIIGCESPTAQLHTTKPDTLEWWWKNRPNC